MKLETNQKIFNAFITVVIIIISFYIVISIQQNTYDTMNSFPLCNSSTIGGEHCKIIDENNITGWMYCENITERDGLISVKCKEMVAV